MGGDDWRDTGAAAGGYTGVASVVWICRLYEEERNEAEAEADVHLKSNNPTLKGGE